MNILTKVDRGGRQLEMWYTGGKRRIIDPPCPPHFWSPYERADGEYQPRPLMSDISKEVALWRVDARTVYDVRRLRDNESMEADIPFIQLLVMLYGFNQRDTKAKVGAFDIEAISGTGQFPNSHRDPIYNAAYVSATREEVFDGPEESIIEGLCDIFQTDDPDVPATYYGNNFDWNYTFERGRMIGTPFRCGRLKDEPYIRQYDAQFGKQKGEVTRVWLNGRAVFDVYREVFGDTSLTGEVPNRGLKAVAKHFIKLGELPSDLDVIEVPYYRMHKLDKDTLNEYVLSDARLTYHLAEYYLAVLKDLAVMYQAPLNIIIDRTPNHLGNFLYGTELKKLGVVSDANNYDRFEGILW